VGREVRVGARAGEAVEILEGLEPGEEVVAKASFLIDSQSQLQTGASVQWGGASEVKDEKTPPPGQHGQHGGPGR
jgi:Cu(I)/Ag(I) efflux system membrane fusion protein